MTNNILEEEIKRWFEFGNILKNNEGEVFFQMLNECRVYEEGAKTKGPLYSTESLILGIIFNQQRLIKELIKHYGRYGTCSTCGAEKVDVT